MNIIDKMNNVEPETAKKELIKLMDEYLSPSFGSITKKNIDILMFMTLQNLETKALGDAGGDIVENVSDYLTPILNGSIEQITETFTKLNN